MSLLLTKEERDKFALWLEREAQSDDAMSKQLEILKGHDVMAKQLKLRASMFSIVAQEIRRIEDG